MPPSQDDGDAINLFDLLDIVLDGRWLIAGITVLALAAGAGYALLSTPVYQADTLIQVEDTKVGGASNLLGDMSGLFDIKSPAVAEIEILRSRLVLGQAVDNLQLDLDVRPKYLPLVGRWLARRSTAPSSPGLLGWGGYVSGTEALQVTHFKVPPALAGKRCTVVLGDSGYRLIAPEGGVLGEGRFGQPLAFQYQGVAGELLVAAAQGRPGAAFHVTRFSRRAVTDDLQGAIRISEQGKQSGMIRSTLEGDDPVRIARILNEVGRLYVRQNVQRKAAEAEKSLAFLDTQLPKLRGELEASERKFNQFRDRNGVFDLDNEARIMLDQGAKLQISLVELQQKRKELEARFTSAHPGLQTIDAQIRDVNGELAKLNSRSKLFPSVEQDLLRLTRDVKVNNQLYTGLLNSLQQLRLVKAGRVGNVRFVDEAVVPEQSVKPRRFQIVALAGAFGLLAGLMLAFVRSSLRPGIKDPSEIEQRSGLHVFATVPHSKVQERLAKAIKDRLSGNHVLAVQSPDDPVVESLRSLRTALQFAMLDAGSNLVLFTGPTPGIGKSFTSVNFAAVASAAGKRVLLIDADLRKGYLHDYFGQSRGGGLSEVASGSMSLAEALRRDVVQGVDFLSTGILPPNPAEVLMAPATRALLQEVSAQYDLVIVDVPPALVVSDAGILAQWVGAVFMVARAEVTSLGELQEAAKRLAQTGAQVRGVIFNDLDIDKRRHSYGLGYRYRYTHYKY
jgi:tyrosine-protein kinase Etk/Wzc